MNKTKREISLEESIKQKQLELKRERQNKKNRMKTQFLKRTEIIIKDEELLDFINEENQDIFLGMLLSSKDFDEAYITKLRNLGSNFLTKKEKENKKNKKSKESKE